jgi:PAS domain S-box-containing protein
LYRGQAFEGPNAQPSAILVLAAGQYEDVESARASVLLVDDEPQVLVALEDLLCDEFVIHKAESAERALNVVEREKDIAVVLSDQRMPDMTGDELLRTLHDSCGATRMLVTGFADLSAVIRAVNDGRIFAYVTKPWNPDELQLMVRKAAEHFRLAQDLAYERSLLHDLMDNTPDGIFFKDRQLRFLRTNRAFSQALNGKTPSELVGRRLNEILGPSSAEALNVEAEERRVLAGGIPLQDAVHESQQPGGTQHLSETKAPIRALNGETIGLVGISRNVTERVRAEAQLRRVEAELLQAQKMEAIGQLAGGVAHDFNNVLSVILGYGEMLLEELPAEHAMHGDLSVIVGAAQRAAALTRQLLAFSRRRVVEPDVVDLNTIVWGIDKMLRRIIGEDIDLRTKLASSPATVRADASQLEQVIMNLTVNARDAMPNGGTIQIETESVELDEAYSSEHVGVTPGTYVRMSVTDTGHGIDEATQKRIFEPFFTTKEVGRGTGLGLSTVYGIVQQCGGHVVVDSEVGRGTAFHIHLPEAIQPAAEPRIRRAPTRPPTGSGTVLVVEDDAEVRQVTVRMLREHGYKVLEAGGSGDALQIAGEHRAGIDVLLTDVVMPEASGPKLAADLAVIIPGLRVLYMSGYAGVLLEKGVTLGPFTGYIEKPFSPAVLAARVTELLGN